MAAHFVLIATFWRV